MVLSSSAKTLIAIAAATAAALGTFYLPTAGLSRFTLAIIVLAPPALLLLFTIAHIAMGRANRAVLLIGLLGTALPLSAAASSAASAANRSLEELQDLRNHPPPPPPAGSLDFGPMTDTLVIPWQLKIAIIVLMLASILPPILGAGVIGRSTRGTPLSDRAIALLGLLVNPISILVTVAACSVA